MKEKSEGRILLVDGERLTHFMVSAFLTAARFSVTAVDTLDAAMGALKADDGEPYDAILCNLYLGQSDGFMLRDAVRAVNGRIPILFLLTFINAPTPQLQARVAADPYSSYTAKNVQRDILLLRVRQLVHAYRDERATAATKDLLKTDLAIAASVQRAISPPYVRLGPKLFYSTLSIPRKVVTGDLFYWYGYEDTSRLLVFGDISGHGLAASLAMTAVQAYLSTLDDSACVRMRDPCLVCREIDRFFRAHLRDVCYLTGTVIYLDFKENVARYMNAGGIEPLCFSRADGARIELNPGGKGCLPMGIQDGTEYPESEVVEAHFPKDAFFCLHSDGYVDLSVDAAGEQTLPQSVLNEIISELMLCGSGTMDMLLLPYRLNSALQDMGYLHHHDDMHIVVVGSKFDHPSHLIMQILMNDPREIDSAVAKASAWATERGLPEEMVVRLELLMDEHLTNVRRHGLTNAQRAHELVFMEMFMDGKSLEVSFWDRGRKPAGDFSELAPHPDIALEVQNAALAEGGRGFSILRKVVQNIDYRSCESVNKFTYVLSPGGGGGVSSLPNCHEGEGAPFSLNG